MHTYTAHVSPDQVRLSQPRVVPLTAQSRGRGNWDCLRQMQMYRRRPDVLAAALRDMGFNESGDECEPHEHSADDQCSDNQQN